MLVRSVAIAAILLFASASLAQEKLKIDWTNQLKPMLACGEIETAKHILTVVPLGLLSAYDPALLEELRSYNLAMNGAETCADFAAAYNLVAELSKSSGLDREAYFTTAEGLQELEELAAGLTKMRD
jgi:hypothetical protein